MWEDHKEVWEPKNGHFQTVVLEKTLESPLDWKKIKSVNPKVNQSWIFIGRTDSEAEAPELWPPDGKGWLNGKILIGIFIIPILQMRKLRLREINQREEGRKEGKKEGIEGGVGE